MAKRHTLQRGDWESIFRRLQELVLANSGVDPFEEVFKILVAKIQDETEGGEKSFWSRESPEATGDAINKLIAKASDRWKGIVQEDAQTQLRDEHLQVCVEEIEDLVLSDSSLEVLDSLFEHLTSQSSKGSKGQYFTPRHVIDCAIKMVDPSPEDSVVDPACGSAGFLIHTLQHVTSENPSVDATEYAEKNLWGFDYDTRAVQVAKALMLMAGAEQSNIYRLNSLLTPSSNRGLFSAASTNLNGTRTTIEDITRSQFNKFDGFDVVVTNPPFAGEIKEENLLSSYSLPRSDSREERDILFLERCVDITKKRGDICIVLPHNKLGSKRFSYLRKWLIQRVRIISVVSLGRNTFRPHTDQKTSILIGKKRSEKKSVGELVREECKFYISEKSGKDSTGSVINKEGVSRDEPEWVRAKHDLDKIYQDFNSKD